MVSLNIICRPLAGSTRAAAISAATLVLWLRKPMRWLAWNIFCHAAVVVTMSNQASGSSVVQA